VAVTRASERLILVEGLDYGSDVRPLPFLKYINTDYETFCNKSYLAINGKPPKDFNPGFVNVEDQEEMRTNPTDLIKFINDDILRSLVFMKEAIFKKKSPPTKQLDIPYKIKNNMGLTENVSDLNGLAIPMIWETKLKGTSAIHKFIASQSNLSDIIEENIQQVPTTVTKPEDFLRLVNIYQAIVSGYHFKLAQIGDYNWLSQDLIDLCHSSMNTYLDNSVVFEKEIAQAKYTKLPQGTVYISGRIDAFDFHNIYEFKCVSEFTIEHFLQLVIYAWLWKQPQESNNNQSYFEIHGYRKFLLVNLQTDEIYELDSNSNYINDIVDLLIENKYLKKNANLSDNEFIKRCLHEQGSQNALVEKIAESVNLSLNNLDILKNMCKDRNIKIGKSTKAQLIEKLKNYETNENNGQNEQKPKSAQPTLNSYFSTC
jgi:hypothetical protein